MASSTESTAPITNPPTVTKPSSPTTDQPVENGPRDGSASWSGSIGKITPSPSSGPQIDPAATFVREPHHIHDPGVVTPASDEKHSGDA